MKPTPSVSTRSSIRPRKLPPIHSPLQQPETPAAIFVPTILLVDDDPSVRDSLERVLSGEGWRVVTAASGEQALILLNDAEPDLMITDLRMNDVSGWDLLFHERMQRPRLPILVITALPPTAAGGADQFATRFFQKPLDVETLIAAIRECLLRARTGKQ